MAQFIAFSGGRGRVKKYMTDYKGVIIEESLEKKDVLQKVKILQTKVEKTTEWHQTPL